MQIRLVQRGADEATVTLAAHAELPDGPLRLRYPTRTGALLRVDGVIRGAFDGMHPAIDLQPMPGRHELMLEVERRSLPVAGLPDGDGVRWRLMLARAAQKPHEQLGVEVRDDGTPSGEAIAVPLVGHAHLDIAWLWTYDATHRKALRTFATALREIENDPRFVFAQSQPQLYAWAFRDDHDLGERIRAHAAGRMGRERRGDVGGVRSARTQRRVGAAPVRARHPLDARQRRRRADRRMAARHVRVPVHVPDARGARRRAVLRDDEAAVERHDALAVPALSLVRRRRRVVDRRGDRQLRRRA